jgi:pantothenate synthetase
VTVRDWGHDYCVKRGMSPDQAKAVVDSLVASPPCEPMQGRWNDDVDEYPRHLLDLLHVSVDCAAVAWIDANCPEAWYRKMFGP